MKANRALLPELIRFAYIPQSQHRINAASQVGKGKSRAESPDFSIGGSRSGGALEDDEHVLILDFAEIGAKGKYKKEAQYVLSQHLGLDQYNDVLRSDMGFSVAPSLAPAAMKKLIETRNDRFTIAVDE